MEFNKIGTGYHIISKPVGAKCNLKCEYCFYLEKMNFYKNSDFIMPENVLENYIKKYINTQDIPVIQFVWQGGEPMLAGIEYYKKIIKLQKKYANGKKIENSIQGGYYMIKKIILVLFLLTLNSASIICVYGTQKFNPKTDYGKEFIDLNQGETWLLEEVEKILNQQGKSINTIESEKDLLNIYSIGIKDKNINGSIPIAIGEIKNLENMFLSNNNLVGELPNEIYELQNLKNLDISHNNLTGQLSENIKNFENLEVILLSNNNLTGTLPNNLNDLKSLTTIDLSSNQLTGKIPENIGQLNNLKYIGIADNNIEGEIPKSLANLNEIENIVLWGNQLSGEIPEEISNLDNLKLIDLSDNKLTGDIPKGLNNSNVVIKIDNNNMDKNSNISTRPYVATNEKNKEDNEVFKVAKVDEVIEKNYKN